MGLVHSWEFISASTSACRFAFATVSFHEHVNAATFARSAKALAASTLNSSLSTLTRSVSSLKNEENLLTLVTPFSKKCACISPGTSFLLNVNLKSELPSFKDSASVRGPTNAGTAITLDGRLKARWNKCEGVPLFWKNLRVKLQS